MPTYTQLGEESQWAAEVEAPAHAALNTRLRAHYGHTRNQTGSKGDNRHLYGRHRSRNWVLHSEWCTDRGYGTRDPRDKAGDGDWLRATDLGVTGTEHRAVSRRLDTAVRAGRLPCLAEWFGSFDGRRVVGWFEGQPGDSDDSHLSHIHLGLWTKFCNDTAQLRLLGDVITGTEPAPTPTAPPPPRQEDDMSPEERYVQHVINYRLEAILAKRPEVNVPEFWDGERKRPALKEPNQAGAALTELLARANELLGKPPVESAPVDPAVVQAAVLAALATVLADLAAAVARQKLLGA